MFGRARNANVIALILAAAAVPVAFASPASAEPPSPVTIETVIDFSSFPFVGTFTVSEGAAALGCSAGTFVDIPRGEGPAQIEKHLSCTSGPGAGDEIVVLFRGDCTWNSHAVFRCKPGPGDLDGQWTVLSGTGAFADLHGNGDFSVLFVSDTTGEETFTGWVS